MVVFIFASVNAGWWMRRWQTEDWRRGCQFCVESGHDDPLWLGSVTPVTKGRSAAGITDPSHNVQIWQAMGLPYKLGTADLV
jgi:hypothetical protein